MSFFSPDSGPSRRAADELDAPEAPEKQPVIAIPPGIARVSPAADWIVNRPAHPLPSFSIERFEAMKNY